MTDRVLAEGTLIGDRLAVHTQTTKPLKLDQAILEYQKRGIRGISVWKEALEGFSAADADAMIRDHGLSVPALVRGGFFCAATQAERQQRIDDNRRLIEIASILNAQMLVLVVGAIPGVALEVQRGWVQDGVAALTSDAKAANVKIAIEPLHPMYAGDKSCVNRIAEANAICDSVNDPIVGVAVDVYHTWWDPDLETQIETLGRHNRLFAFHLCDWRVPTRDLLTDRALMGDGCIPISRILNCVEAAGFRGWHEVEIFSTDHWSSDQGCFLDQIISRYER